MAHKSTNLDWLHLCFIAVDKIFLRLLDEDAPFFLLKLSYSGDTLTRAVLNGRDLPVGHGRE